MNRRFEVLDSLRGLCAIAVVIFHVRLEGSITEWSFFRGSYLFVELFFVLSGFVMAHGYATRKPVGFSPFVTARFFRIFPLHIFMLAVFVLLELGKYLAHTKGIVTFNNPPFTGMGDPSQLIPNLLLVHAWTPFTSVGSFNYPSWSISIEFYTYLIFYVTLIIGGKRNWITWLLLSVSMLTLLENGSSVLETKVMQGVSSFFTGSLTYLVYMKLKGLKIGKAVGTVIEISIFGLVILMVSGEISHSFTSLIALFSLTVFIFSFESGYLSSFLKLNPFQIAGKLSYSIYLTHAAFLFCYTALFMVLSKIIGANLTVMVDDVRYVTTGSAIGNNLVLVAIIAFVLLQSVFSYKYIEVPFIQKGKNVIQLKAIKAATSA
ncbi:acyltransferase [Vibrio alginolyticus]|nr:acyltransferase [Vibrio alginolyticus]